MQQQLISDQLSVSLNSFGAEVCSVKNKEGLEFVWQADKGIWARHAPVLFPIVGKLQDNTFVYEGKKYQLPQHGFARDLEFELLSSDENSCRFQLKSTPETKTKFPFDFIFEIGYQLEGSTLTNHYSIKNPSDKELLFSLGAHPGFNCPLIPGEKFGDHYLLFEKDSFLRTKLNNGLRSEEKLPLKLKDNRLFLSENLFDNDALVFGNDQINTISLCSTKSPHKITLNCKGWPYFGIWSKKGSPQFVCLEPWYGIADHENSNGQLSNKDGILRLEPGKEFNCSFSTTFT